MPQMRLSYKFKAQPLPDIANLRISRDMTDAARAIEEMPPLPTSPDELMAKLEELGIEYDLHRHEAVFTVAEAQKVERGMRGVHCRNLFLRDKKKNNFLVVLCNETEIDMKKLAPVIGAEKLSFGSADRLWAYLGVRPGSVCPYAIVNDRNNEVKIILEKKMMEADIVNYHPLLNTMTIGTTPANLLKFIESTNHTPHILDLGAAAPDRE